MPWKFNYHCDGWVIFGLQLDPQPLCGKRPYMNQLAVLAPVFVLIAMTFGLLYWQARARIAALRSKQTAMRDIALGQANWPPRATQINRAFQNQFELPVLFYVLVALVLATGRQSTLFLVIEWLFVAARLVHAYVHTTTNFVLHRFRAYAAGMAILGAGWLWFAFVVARGG